MALEVDITLNRYLDHDPDGRMYALADRVDDSRSEEAANAAARRDRDALPGASLGLQGDAIQPLVIRARPGECLSLGLQNDLEAEDASILVHRLHGGAVRWRRQPGVESNGLERGLDKAPRC